MALFFPSGGQTIGVSASTSVLPMNIQDWFPLGLTDLISFQSKGLSRVFNTTVHKHQFSGLRFLYTWLYTHPYMITGKTIALTIQTFVGKVMSLLFNMLSRLVITICFTHGSIYTSMLLSQVVPPSPPSLPLVMSTSPFSASVSVFNIQSF